MISFKQFLKEGGNATKQFNTSRANANDIFAVLKFVSEVLGIPSATLKNDLLGSTVVTLVGKKADSGDVDIAMQDANVQDIHKKMMNAVKNEGVLNEGTRVGSYAVPVNGKKIQTDLMFVKNKDWAKFVYYSSHGLNSRYSGAVRNIILINALIYRIEPGKDFVLKDKNGNLVARASRSLKLDTGIERLFKKVKINPKTGKISKTLEKVSPSELQEFLKSLGKNIKFSNEPDIIDNPDQVAKFIFGGNVQAKDLMTAEKVIEQIKKLPNSKEILASAVEDLTQLKMTVPNEAEQ